jgi:hypothetical protein
MVYLIIILLSSAPNNTVYSNAYTYSEVEVREFNTLNDCTAVSRSLNENSKEWGDRKYSIGGSIMSYCVEGAAKPKTTTDNEPVRGW